MDRRARPRRRIGGALLGAVLALVAVMAPEVSGATTTRAWVVSVSFPPPIANLESLSCFSSTGCVAVGWSTAYNGLNSTSIELRTVDGGAHWLPVALPHGLLGLYEVACIGAICLTGGGGDTLLRSTNDGATWGSVTLPPTITNVSALACPTTTACYAEGQGIGFGATGAIVGSTDGGATWSTQYTETSTYLHDLWCAAATSCFTFGSTFVDTSDGMTWAPYSAPTNFPTEGTCLSASTCVGLSPYEGLVTSGDGGASWTVTDGAFVPTALACGGTTTCVATDGSDLEVSTDAGTTWSERTPTFQDQQFVAISCLSGSNCQAVGSADADGYQDRALMLEVGPSETSFLPERVTNAIDVAGSVSCPSPTVCDAGGVDAYGNPVLLRTTNGGGQWSNEPLPSMLAGIDQIACSTTTSCLLVGSNANGKGAVWRTTSAGASWTASVVPSTVGEVEDVSCVSAARCMAVGYLTNSWTAVLESTNGGRSWISIAMPHVVSDLFGIDCVSTVSCVVVGDRSGGSLAEAYYTTNGRTWHPSKIYGSLQALQRVSCISKMVCLAASDELHGAVPHAEVARTVNGGVTWVPVPAPGTTATLSSLLCWSPTTCEAVGQTTAVLDPNDQSAAAAIVTVNAGRTWTAQRVPQDQWGLLSVSCARGGVCFAVGVGSYDPPNFPTGATILRLT